MHKLIKIQPSKHQLRSRVATSLRSPQLRISSHVAILTLATYPQHPGGLPLVWPSSPPDMQAMCRLCHSGLALLRVFFLPDPMSNGHGGRELNPSAPPYYPHPSTATQDTMIPNDTLYQRQPTNFVIELYEAHQYPPTLELFQHVIEDPTNPQIGNLKTEMRDIRRELEELIQCGRRNALMIFNPRWPEVRGKNTDSLILDLTNNVLKVKLDSSKISRSHRICRPSASNIGPILATRTHLEMKGKWRSTKYLDKWGPDAGNCLSWFPGTGSKKGRNPGRY